jgi:hypothetical protein
MTAPARRAGGWVSSAVIMITIGGAAARAGEDVEAAGAGQVDVQQHDIEPPVQAPASGPSRPARDMADADQQART